MKKGFKLSSVNFFVVGFGLNTICFQGYDEVDFIFFCFSVYIVKKLVLRNFLSKKKYFIGEINRCWVKC